MRCLIVLCAVLVLSGCARRYDHVSELEIDDVIVRVGLKQQQATPVKYQKFLEVARAGEVAEKEIPPERGTPVWVTVIDNRGTLEIKDAAGLLYSRSLGPNAARTRAYMGRFDFDAGKKFRFISVIEDPKEPGTL